MLSESCDTCLCVFDSYLDVGGFNDYSGMPRNFHAQDEAVSCTCPNLVALPQGYHWVHYFKGGVSWTNTASIQQPLEKLNLAPFRISNLPWTLFRVKYP